MLKSYFPFYLWTNALLNCLFVHHYGSEFLLIVEPLFEVMVRHINLQGITSHEDEVLERHFFFLPYLQAIGLIRAKSKHHAGEATTVGTPSMTATSGSCCNIATNECLGKMTEICCLKMIVWISILIHHGKKLTYVIKLSVKSHCTNIW